MGPWTRIFFINIALSLAVCVGYVYFGGLGDGTPQRGSPAPVFDLPVISAATVDARTRLSLGDFRGRPLLVNFWASWCGVCRSERPQLTDLGSMSGLTVVGIATSDTREAAAVSESSDPHGYPVVLDGSGTVSDEYAVQGLPHTFLIDGDGKILKRYGRALRSSDVEDIRKLVEDLGKGKA